MIILSILSKIIAFRHYLTNSAFCILTFFFLFVCLQKRPEPPFPSELLVSVVEPGEAGE